MPNIDTKNWAWRNLWTDASGNVVVRPGLREIATATTYDSEYEFLWGTSAHFDTTDEIRHYLAAWDETNSAAHILILDENYESIQDFTWGYVKPEAITHAVVGNQILICSPQLPTLWGQLGGAIYEAVKADSVNPSFTTIDLPRGLCVAWGGRVVISDGTSVYFSDAWAITTDVDTQNAPRAFVSTNVVNPTGAGMIRGLHVSANGDLYVVSNTGVWALNFEAGITGQFVRGSWQKVTDYDAAVYGGSCISRGRLWGLTKRGMRLLDAADGPEFLLNEPTVSTSDHPRISVPNYLAVATLLPGEDGPICALEDVEAAHFVDHSSQGTPRSWWFHSASSGFKIRGLLKDYEGNEILVTDDHLILPIGNYDTGEATVKGSFVGRMPSEPEDSQVIRDIHVNSDTQNDIFVNIGDDEQTATMTITQPCVVGTNSWDSGSTYRELFIQSVSVDYAERTDDIAIQFGAEDCGSRIDPRLNFNLRGVGRKRDDS